VKVYLRPVFRIGEFAALTRVSQRMLRHYDEIGLLRPDSVDSRTGYRGYSAAQLPRLNRIIALKELGFGLEEVARLLDANISVDEMRLLLERRREELEHRVRSDQDRLTQIANRLRAIERDERFPLGDVVVRPVAAALMATLRTVVPSLGKPVEHLFDESEAYVARHHARSAASPVLLFHETPCSEGFDVEVAIPLEHRIPSTTRISVRQIRGCDTMACVVYTGGYHQTEHAVRTLREWASALRWTPRGRVREVYLRFGADNADALRLPPKFLADREADYVTEVQLPVAATSAPAAP
jgi:DNA-binding transcriptional MerR regulator